MEPTLTPHLALAYLRELSTDVRGGIVLDRAWTRLAGDPAIEAGVRELLSTASESAWIQVRASAGWVFAACSTQGAVALVTGRHALPGLVRHDLSAVVVMLASARSAAHPGDVPGAAGTALLAGRRRPGATASGEALSRLADGIHAALPPVAGQLGADR